MQCKSELFRWHNSQIRLQAAFESAAEKAGMKAGDVITRIGAQKVSSPSEISRALRSLSSTKAIPVTIVRERKETTVNVTIEDKSSEALHVVRMDL